MWSRARPASGGVFRANHGGVSWGAATGKQRPLALIPTGFILEHLIVITRLRPSRVLHLRRQERGCEFMSFHILASLFPGPFIRVNQAFHVYQRIFTVAHLLCQIRKYNHRQVHNKHTKMSFILVSAGKWLKPENVRFSCLCLEWSTRRLNIVISKNTNIIKQIDQRPDCSLCCFPSFLLCQLDNFAVEKVEWLSTQFGHKCK